MQNSIMEGFENIESKRNLDGIRPRIIVPVVKVSEHRKTEKCPNGAIVASFNTATRREIFGNLENKEKFVLHCDFQVDYDKQLFQVVFHKRGARTMTISSKHTVAARMETAFDSGDIAYGRYPVEIIKSGDVVAARFHYKTPAQVGGNGNTVEFETI